MVQPRSDLVNYIYSNLKAGYPLDSIKQQLKAQGFQDLDIKTAIDFVYANYYYSANQDPVQKDYSAYQTSAPRKIGIPEISVLILVIFGVVLIGVALVFLLFSNKSETTADNTDNNNPSADNVNTSVPTNPNPPSTNPNNNNTNLTKPPVNPNKNNSGTTTNPGDTTPIVTNPTTGNNNGLTPYPTDNITLKFDSTKSYTTRQIEIAIEELAVPNPEEAMLFCTKYSNDAKKEYCYTNIAEKAKMPELCTRIVTETIKDDCNLQMIVSDIGNQDTCLNIKNAYKRETCKQLNLVKERPDLFIPAQPPAVSSPATNSSQPTVVINDSTVTTEGAGYTIQ